MNDLREQNVGLTKGISIIYLIYSVFMAIAITTETTIGGELVSEIDVFLPLIVIIISFATIRRIIWGRWASYLVSFMFLFGVPLGTVIGGYMIWHLTKYRSSFNRWH